MRCKPPATASVLTGATDRRAGYLRYGMGLAVGVLVGSILLAPVGAEDRAQGRFVARASLEPSAQILSDGRFDLRATLAPTPALSEMSATGFSVQAGLQSIGRSAVCPPLDRIFANGFESP